MTNVFSYLRVVYTEEKEKTDPFALIGNLVPKQNQFVDTCSGRGSDQMEYQKMIAKLQPGDLLYIPSIGHLGRNNGEIKKQWEFLTKEIGVDVCVLEMPLLDTRTDKDLSETFVADLVLQLLAFFAEKERCNALKRRQGMDAAKTRGVKFGRPDIKPPDNFATIVRKWETKQIAIEDAVKESGLSERTFYRRLKEYRRSGNE